MVNDLQNVILTDDIYTLNLNKGNSKITNLNQSMRKSFFSGQARNYPVSEAYFGTFSRSFIAAEEAVINMAGGLSSTATSITVNDSSSFDLGSSPVTTTLNGAIGIDDTSITLTNGASFRAGDGVVKIDDEYIIYKSRSTHVLTCIRGAYGTYAAAHDDGSTVTDIGFLQIDDEIISYTANNAATKTFTGCVRGENQTIPTAHLNAQIVYSKNPIIYPKEGCTITLTQTADYPSYGRVLIGQEVLKYNSVAGTTLTVNSASERGLDGTTVINNDHIDILECHFDHDCVYLVMYLNKRFCNPTTTLARDAKLVTNSFFLTGEFRDEDSGGMSADEKKRIIERMFCRGGTIGFVWDGGYRSPYLVQIVSFNPSFSEGFKICTYTMELLESVWKRTS